MFLLIVEKLSTLYISEHINLDSIYGDNNKHSLVHIAFINRKVIQESNKEDNENYAF